MRSHEAPTEAAGAAPAAVIQRRDEFDERLLRRLKKCGEHVGEALPRVLVAERVVGNSGKKYKRCHLDADAAAGGGSGGSRTSRHG